jgi:hypothetical protein
MLSARRSLHLLLGIPAFLQIAPRAPCRDGEIVAAEKRALYAKEVRRSVSNQCGRLLSAGRQNRAVSGKP